MRFRRRRAPGDDPDCEPDDDGPIGTLPWYFENGLVSDGDPALAFGPRRANGEFSWENGSRLYYANLTSNFPVARRPEQEFKGAEAIYVSRTDNVVDAAADVKDAWMAPVKVSKQSSATFADKEQIWADNAESSDFFGNVYVCYAKFIGAGAPMIVATSRNGGNTWTESKVSPAHNVAATHWGQSGCTVRTDSDGVVYLFYEEFQNPLKRFPPIGTHFLVKSFDGGATWTKPRALHRVWDACSAVDPVIVRCVEDGIAGARSDLSAAPSVDISNGAPSGSDATDRIVVSWADARDGTNNEHVMVSYSTNHGATFSPPEAIETAGDRGYYAAPAISPNGTDVYVVYNAFTTEYQTTTATPRALVGVVKHTFASDLFDGPPTIWHEFHRGVEGDPRTSSQNNLQAEFLGDYVYAVATRTYGAAVWNDVRDGVDCPAMDAWRQSLRDGTDVEKPAPQQDCPATWGNSDIFSWTSAPAP